MSNFDLRIRFYKRYYNDLLYSDYVYDFQRILIKNNIYYLFTNKINNNFEFA